MTINDVLFFDTETTGIPDRAAKWDVDFESYPHIVQIAWMFGDVQESHIIRPTGWEIPDDTVAVHGITTEYAMEHGESFVFVIDRFIAFAQKAGLICGHNIHFDTGIVKANILRELGHEYYDANDVETALFKGKRIDTMRSTMKWVDARFASGRLKFPMRWKIATMVIRKNRTTKARPPPRLRPIRQRNSARPRKRPGMALFSTQTKKMINYPSNRRKPRKSKI